MKTEISDPTYSPPFKVGNKYWYIRGGYECKVEKSVWLKGMGHYEFWIDPSPGHAVDEEDLEKL